MKVHVLRSVLGVLALVSVAATASADTISVTLDQARIVKMPEKVATIVIGNPQVADASIQAGGLLVVTGKGYGSTNIIALDNRGTVLAEHAVRVGGPKDGLTVWRGVNRESWSCAPRCERSITLGDGTDFFEAARGQAEARNAFSAPQGNSASK